MQITNETVNKTLNKALSKNRFPLAFLASTHPDESQNYSYRQSLKQATIITT